LGTDHSLHAKRPISSYHSLRFSPRDYSRDVVAKFVFGGKDKAGDGAPEGLPLICRFSDATGVLNSISRWRTLILVIPTTHYGYSGSCAVFPHLFNCKYHLLLCICPIKLLIWRKPTIIVTP